MKLIGFLLILIFGTLFLYCAGSFYFVSFDITQWTSEGRLFVLFMLPVVFYVATAPFIL